MSKYEYGQNFDFVGPDKGVYGPQGSQIIYNTGMLGGIVIIANGLFAVAMIVAMRQHEFSPIAAILIAAVYYAFTTLAALLILSGALAQMVTNGQNQRTARHYHDLQYQVMQPPAPQLAAADPLQIPSNEDAEYPPTFVPKFSAQTRAAAAAWVLRLYDERTKMLDPNRVLGPHTKAPGQIQLKKPSQDVIDLLTDPSVALVRVGEGNMLFWTGYDCPTRQEAVNKIAGRKRPQYD